MFGLGTFELQAGVVFILAAGLLVVLPFWHIFKKAGFDGRLAFGMLIPIANVLLIFYLAFSRWPAKDDCMSGVSIK